MSFSQMLESDHDMYEVSVTNPDGAFHSCCQIVHQLQARLDEVEAQLMLGRIQHLLVTPRPVLKLRVEENTVTHGLNTQAHRLCRTT
ncbi:hypothetical protein DPMN_069179 [Dreissena polymorpha]|uniref:Uncharacterized protein n=1 Tax=Dreissena polymorpha TaxID=45954 RepID=A0A9D3Z302_DREPO|nr:hypothetical protein DPMN_069179 [Dreissena polymorpha]